MSTATLTSINSLSPYTGPWTNRQAAHLLRRACYGPIKQEMDEARLLGLEAAVNRLLEDIPLPAPPVYYDYDGHPDAGIGDSWVNLYTPRSDAQQDYNARTRSLDSWLILSTAETGFNVRDKMMLFWHNHFGMAGNNNSSGLIYDFLSKYRTLAVGNFRQLVKDITIHPAMLVFLDGNQNRVGQPNENFAREILELFTIGKGPQVADGDYTHYTEQDVTEMARGFTGWATRNIRITAPGQVPEGYYVRSRHDRETKQLSHRFGNRIIENGEDREYADIIDIIFEQDEVARHLCRKLYRYFVYYKIDETVETEIIEPLARIMVGNDYEVRPVLAALFRSAHFYEMSIVGDMIKNPLEFIHSIFRPVGWYERANVYEKYSSVRPLNNHLNLTGMQIRMPPTVAGWTAYYQEPAFNRLWLNGSTLQLRVEIQQRATTGAYFWDRQRHQADWLPYLETFEDPYSPDAMITEFGERFLPHGLNDIQHAALKDLLLPGLDDFVWSGEYGDYIENPRNEEIVQSVRRRLTEMLFGLLQLAEFQVN